MPPLVIGIRMAPKEFKVIDLEEIDFEKKISDLKSEINAKTGIEKDSMELVYCGNILEDNMSIKSCGVKAGVMVHVLKKKNQDPPEPNEPLTEQNIKALVIAFRTLALNPAYRNSLQKLTRPDIFDSIVQITPGLVNDPVAMSLIQDPELMVRLANLDTVRRIVERHPALAEAANHIAATAHEEALHNLSSSASTSAGYSLLDILSDDDDDMESSQSSDSLQPGMSRQPSFSAITAAQLAAALASAQDAGSSSGGASSSDPSGSGITPEMVQEAMQQAIASVAAPSSGFVNTPSEEGNTDPSSILQEQLGQMRELGLTDDAINIQALQIAGGNLQAAVELVFSGAVGPDPSV